MIDLEFFNTHPMFRHLEGGIVKELKDGWGEKSKVICDNHLTVARDLAHSYKLEKHGAWAKESEDAIVEIFLNHSSIKPFMDEVKEGDKVEAYVMFRDFLAARGGWRIVRDGKVVKDSCSWVS